MVMIKTNMNRWRHAAGFIQNTYCTRYVKHCISVMIIISVSYIHHSNVTINCAISSELHLLNCTSKTKLLCHILNGEIIFVGIIQG